ncbi:MAG: betaine--homocysteine S-methyltransferase [Alphaproteobacteria bacterium]
MTNRFLQLLQDKPTLVADGAMGTNLFKLGLQTGDAPELWNVDEPEKIKTVYKNFVDAGSDIILTNSFGGTEFRLKLHNAQDRVIELNKAAAQLAREVADASGREVAVAGSMGPSGELLAPLGALTEEDAVKAFALQAEGLKQGGADVLWVETMSSIEEASCALKGAQSVGLPIVCTMTFDTAGKTMMGVTPEQAGQLLPALEAKPVAIGANCGVGPTDTMLSIMAIKKANPDAIIISKANCGIPKYENGEFVFTGTPELMGEYAKIAVDVGVKVIGGCCGSSPEVVKAISDAIKDYTPQPIDEARLIATLGEPVNEMPKPDTDKPARRSRRRD